MKLDKVRIREFQSIQDSTEFEIGDIACLVGKNESGKTAILKALYRLNPIIETDGIFNVIDDYPRQSVVAYERDVESGQQAPAQVIQATYMLDPSDITAVGEIFGSKCFKDNEPSINLCKGYSNENVFRNLNMDSEESLRHLVKTAALPQELEKNLLEQKATGDMVENIVNAE